MGRSPLVPALCRQRKAPGWPTEKGIITNTGCGNNVLCYTTLSFTKFLLKNCVIRFIEQQPTNQTTTKQLGQPDGPASKNKRDDPSSILATHNTPKPSPASTRTVTYTQLHTLKYLTPFAMVNHHDKSDFWEERVALAYNSRWEAIILGQGRNLKQLVTPTVNTGLLCSARSPCLLSVSSQWGMASPPREHEKILLPLSCSKTSQAGPQANPIPVVLHWDSSQVALAGSF